MLQNQQQMYRDASSKIQDILTEWARENDGVIKEYDRNHFEELMNKNAVFSNPITLQGTCCFVSDAHFRTPTDTASEERESRLISLLKDSQDKIQHLFLLGDIFDFWFEYDDVVPKGYFRFFNTLYELRQKGVEIYFFTGNHDMWVQDYFATRFGCRIFYQQQAFIINGKRCLIGHGDGLGGKQYGYLVIKSIFGFKPNRILYSMLHPYQAFAIARACSRKSRKSHPADVAVFQNENEPQIQYARQVLQNEPVDYFIYAHRHIPMTYELSDNATYFNTGDWLQNFSYLFFEKNRPELRYYHSNNL